MPGRFHLLMEYSQHKYIVLAAAASFDRLYMVFLLYLGGNLAQR